MNDLIIKYAISPKIKFQALLVSIYLLLMSGTIAVLEVLKSHYEVVFFVGIIGVIISVALILSATISQPKPLVILNNETFALNFPGQRLNVNIPWNEVTHMGIGLSYFTLVMDDQEVHLDLDVLRYHDLKVLKSRLIEIAEARDIPYNNI